MLISRDNRAYSIVLHYGCVNCVPRLHALSRVGTKQFQRALDVAQRHGVDKIHH